jgi:hypothetical protein
MPGLPPRPCPECGAVLQGSTLHGRRIPASSFASCLRQCAPCGVGLSNTAAEGEETYIYRDPVNNIPSKLRPGFLKALGASVNQLNRENKLRKAAFSTSEDALTWTYFNHLRTRGLLHEISFFPCKFEPLLILWGAEVETNQSKVPSLLIEVSNSLREDPARRTEPDVILDFGGRGIAIVEVKYRSANEFKSASYPGWTRYLQGRGREAFLDPLAIRKCGCYELARNWIFGWELGARVGAPVLFVNLGPPSLFVAAAGRLVQEFESCIRRDAMHAFSRLTWQELLNRAPPDTGLSTYFRTKVGFSTDCHGKPSI